MNYATSTNQAPRFAQDGTPGEERDLVLELKLLADVGIVGYPNAGKSTLISVISRARPKIADYPFTTLVPNLGVVSWRGERSFVVADIPGLIEGAHEGPGLGHQFLRHLERCRVLVHLVDGREPGARAHPKADLDAIDRELALYSPVLAKKPQIVVVTKVDVPEARAAGEKLAKLLGRRKKPVKVHLLSAVTGEGVPQLLDAVGPACSSRTRSPARRGHGRRPREAARTAQGGESRLGSAEAARRASRGSGDRGHHPPHHPVAARREEGERLGRGLRDGLAERAAQHRRARGAGAPSPPPRRARAPPRSPRSRAAPRPGA